MSESKRVPREPTQEMLAALGNGFSAEDRDVMRGRAWDYWTTMYDAAPAAPDERVPVGLPDAWAAAESAREDRAVAVSQWRKAVAQRDALKAALRELREASHAYAAIVLPSQGEAESEWTRFCEALRGADALLAAPEDAPK